MWIDGGFPANKIALGLATYGRSFTLIDPSNNGFGAPSDSWSAPMGPYTREGIGIFIANSFQYRTQQLLKRIILIEYQDMQRRI